MSDTKHAGRYIAAEVRSFEYRPAEAPQTPEPEPITPPATAPLIEVAVANMTSERMVAFIRWMQSLYE
jgi:hypothetical protein